MPAFSTRLGVAGQRTFRATVTGFEGTITAAAVIAEATPDRTVVDHRRSVEVLTSRLETDSGRELAEAPPHVGGAARTAGLPVAR